MGKPRRKGAGRRAYLKSYGNGGYIHLGSQVHKRGMRELYYSKTLEPLSYLEKQYPGIPGTPAGRKEVLDRLHQLTQDTGVDLRRPLVDRVSYKLWIHFNPAGTIYYYIEWDLRQGVFRKSVIYNSEAMAKIKRRENKIKWSEEVRTQRPPDTSKTVSATSPA